MENLQINKKGQATGQLTKEVKGLVGLGIVLGIGLFVLNEVYDALPANSQAANSTNLTLFNVAKFATWISIIVVVIAAAWVIKKFASTST